ncbi:P-loop NTPase family protein [Pectobacterium versatile]|uniref:hypothetical protein n=1 Tax=Pectobacterium versatile TaxID=2488639 RepID=UPI001938107C|nr:hypothetical protein [Pectobacterium versatile]QQK73245.1 hypothetical protein HG702_18810 [Pectobacterium versatile]
MDQNIIPPETIFREVSQAVRDMLQQLTELPSSETAVNEARKKALNIMRRIKADLDKQMTSLRNNAEWKTFTLAFYGETNAGKSTIIETLRILLGEETKYQQRQQFQDQLNAVQQSEAQIVSLRHQIQQDEGGRNLAPPLTLWQMLLRLFCLNRSPQQQLAALEKHAAKEQKTLSTLADGGIIGDGRSDFTRETHAYTFHFNGQSFTLLDVPGIEGDEAKVSKQIGKAVQKAHAVIYVTHKAAAPQKGESDNPGTLEKIKQHLDAQTEVWCLFNKRINNPIQLEKPLVGTDEQDSLNELNLRMREQLGDNYRETVTLSARPAFLAVADNVLPDSKNASDREKFLQKHATDTLLDKSGMKDFVSLLTVRLLADSRKKIQQSNFNKASIALKNAADDVLSIQREVFQPLSETLRNGLEATSDQMDNALAALNARLISQGNLAIETFKNKARKAIYSRIDDDISNDVFKSELETCIKQQLNTLEQLMPEKVQNELATFQKDIQEIIDNNQQRVKELQEIYSRAQSGKLRVDFTLNIDIDSGVKWGGLLATLTGGAALFWNPGGWVMLTAAIAGIVISIAKSVWGFFDSDYKKEQQRKSASKNLSTIADYINDNVRNSLNSAMPELEAKMQELKKMLEMQVNQIAETNQMLNQGSAALRKLSTSLDMAAGAN